MKMVVNVRERGKVTGRVKEERIGIEEKVLVNRGINNFLQEHDQYIRELHHFLIYLLR